MTSEEVVEAVACALIDEDPWLCRGARGTPLLPDDYRNLARAAIGKVRELRLTVVTGDDC